MTTRDTKFLFIGIFLMSVPFAFATGHPYWGIVDALMFGVWVYLVKT